MRFTALLALWFAAVAPPACSAAPWTPPIIDLDEYRKGGAERDRMVFQLREACVSTGFFYLKGHGIPEATSSAALKAMRRFFELPLSDKLEVHVDRSLVYPPTSRGYIGFGEERLDPSKAGADRKEVLDLGREEGLEAAATPFHGPNRWPSGLPAAEFKAPVLAHQAHLWAVARELSHAFALALGQDAGHFDRLIDDPCIIHRLNHYPQHQGPLPPSPDGGDRPTMECGAHTDYGFFTLLTQVGGGEADLQAFIPGSGWVAVPPKEGLLNVNLGDLMAIWSNGLFKSTLHRVVNSSGQQRYSVAFFFDPNFDARVEPIAQAGREEHDSPSISGVPSAGRRKLAKFEATWDQLEKRSGWDEETQGALFEGEAARSCNASI